VADLTIQRAAILALQTYLVAEIPTANVLGHWPSGETLKAKTLSIVPAGPREEIWSSPRVVRETVIDATTKSYTWRIRAIAQPVQLDVWIAGSDAYSVSRDEFLQQVDAALHQGLGNANSLAKANGRADPFRDGVLLNLDPTTGHQGTVDVVLLSGPAENDAPDAATRKEWRSTIRLELRTDLELTATSTRLLRVLLAMRIGERPLGTSPEMNFTFDATS
jgi:hypothetical protein